MADGGPGSAEAASAPAGSFEQLYRAHFDAVLGQLRRMGVDEGSLEDAAQDVFVVVHRKVGGFEGRARMSTWLFSIAHHIAARYRRTSFRTDRRHRRLADEAIGLRNEVGVDEAVLRKQADELLHAFLDTLPPEQRGAFVLGEIEELPRRELGIALGVSPNTAYSRLRLARARFSEAFGSEDGALLQRWRVPVREPARRDAVWAALVLELPAIGKPVAIGALASFKVWAIAGVAAVALGLGVERSTRAAPRHVSTSIAALRSIAPPPIAVAAIAPAEAPRVAAPAPTPLAAESRPTTRAASPARAELARMPAPDDLQAELSALADARAALKAGKPEQALARLREHAERFGAGAFAVDREVLRIDALCAAGREQAAIAATQAFLRAHAQSAQAAHVRAGCGAS
ncbi:MAG TPA: sigma-70 family RNA polymerase sigma factor [Nannocystaceae bacterium]|nr:sigma-70 family RNA polymerase sigma factor [Nannocystaceae bacterium]